MKPSSDKLIITVDVVGRYQLEITGADLQNAHEFLSLAWPCAVRIIASDESIEIVD